MKVLFVCMVNQNRSQIAEAIFNKMSKKNTATSVGLAPLRRNGSLLKNSHEEGIRYPPTLPMKELGYDLSKARIKRINKRMVASADKIVFIFSLAKHGEEIPAYARNLPNNENWDIGSISEGIPFQEYCRLERKRIKLIQKRVKELVKRIG